MNPGLTVPPAYRLTFLGLLLLAVGCNPVDPQEGLRGLTTRCSTDESCAPGFVCEERHCVLESGEACREGFLSELCPDPRSTDPRRKLSQGVCADARVPCVNGTYASTCSPEAFGPDFELDETRCDGLDNDCDGTVDRGPCERVLGVCAGAVRLCTGGTVVRTCGAESYGPQYQALETRCDGLDNDCDGMVDRSHATRLPFFFPTPLPAPVAPVISLYETGEPRVVPFGDGFLGITPSTVVTHYQQVDGAPWRPPTYQSRLAVVPLDGDLVPVGFSSVLQESARDLQELQVVPFDGGVFLFWSGSQFVDAAGQPSYSYQAYVARLDVGATPASPQLRIPVQAVPAPFAAGPVRVALSRDSQQLLLARNVGQVRAQLFSRELEPRSEELRLDAPHPDDVSGAYFSRLDVSAHGDSGFAVAWALSHPSSTAPNAPSVHQLRFRRFDGALQPLGEVAGLTGETGSLTDLRVLGAASSDEALFAAWQVDPPDELSEPPTPAPAPEPPILRYAWPFAPGSPSSAPMEVQFGSSRVPAARAPTDEVLLGLELIGRSPRLRRFDATRAFVEQDLLLPVNTTLQAFSLLRRGDPDVWTLTYSSYDRASMALGFCRF